MMSKFLLGGAIAAFAATAAFAQSAPPTGKAGMHGRMLQTEARTDVAANVGKMFARLDTNHDGFVTKAEVDTLEAQRDAKLKERLEKRAKNFDPAKVFGHLDANHDGKITQAEAESARTAHVHGEPGKPAEAHATAMGALFTRGDTNKDGVISRAEFDAMANQMHARMDQAGLHHGAGAGRMFGMADTNKDGKVSLAEAQSVALQQFDRADLNHDGKLTPDERKQARQQLKAQRTPS
jgi:Ca2+-binding EF-hand superfamily protein